MKSVKNPTNNPESFALQRRIGSTTFLVNIHFNHASRETLEEKAVNSQSKCNSGNDTCV